MKDQLFRDADAITRSADELQVDYTTWEIIGRIWREHLRPRLGLLLIASAAMLLTAATTGAIPFLIQRTADDVFVGKKAEMVYLITAAIVVVTVVKAIAEYVADVTVAYLGNRFIADLRLQMFAKLARADLNWIQRVHSGRLLAGFLNDATLIRQTASRSMVTLGESFLKVIILVGTMFYMDPRFSLLILIFMPIAWIMLSRQRRKMRKSTTKSLQETGDLSALKARPCAACAWCAPTGRRRKRRLAPPRRSTARSNSPCVARGQEHYPARRWSCSPDLALRWRSISLGRRACAAT